MDLILHAIRRSVGLEKQRFIVFLRYDTESQ